MTEYGRGDQDDRWHVRPVLTLQQERDQALLDEAASRRARGEKVKALRGAEDGELRIYTKAEAGPAWSNGSSSRAVFSLGGQIVLVGIISVVMVALIVLSLRYGPDELPIFAVGFVIGGVVWVASAIVLIRTIIAVRLRRRRGLPEPVPGSEHLGAVVPRPRRRNP